jgi:SAM-dependent methyltransferase
VNGPGASGSHWDGVYASRRDVELSWYQATPDISLRLLDRFAVRTGSVIDVGAGSSPLAGALVDAGWRDVTVLDVSAAALAVARDRLGDRAPRVSFVTGNLLSWRPQRTYDAWHDRAVFHFLVDAADRERYVALAEEAVAPGGAVVLGTFAADGPTSCSGMPTARYDPNDLADLFAPGFSLAHAEREQHHTPGGTVQPFSWVVLRAASVASPVRQATEG